MCDIYPKLINHSNEIHFSCAKVHNQINQWKHFNQPKCEQEIKLNKEKIKNEKWNYKSKSTNRFKCKMQQYKKTIHKKLRFSLLINKKIKNNFL